MEQDKAEAIEIGVGGECVAPGDRLCVLYTDARERDALVGPNDPRRPTIWPSVDFPPRRSPHLA
jgi:hypothetical protein